MCTNHQFSYFKELKNFFECGHSCQTNDEKPLTEI